MIQELCCNLVFLCFSDGLNGWVWDTFRQTVPMPTYLVALIISDYAYAEASKDLYNKPTRVTIDYDKTNCVSFFYVCLKHPVPFNFIDLWT